MKSYDKKEKIKLILLEFEQYDKYHHKFSLEFEHGIYNFIADHPNCITPKEGFSDDLKSFAVSLINCAYEVVEKDKSYPSSRMALELENMEHLIERYPLLAQNDVFPMGFTQMAKAKMTKYFPKLYNLSADGFRLLERSTTYRINSFLIYHY